jgi:hypothetical protein
MNEDSLTSIVEPHTVSVSFLTSLVAGGIAGTSVDVALFPIDTIKVSKAGRHAGTTVDALSVTYYANDSWSRNEEL